MTDETEEIAVQVVETPTGYGDVDVATLVVDRETRVVRDWTLESDVEVN